MKFSILSLLAATATATDAHKDITLPSSISATSELGQSLLSSARRLNNDQNNYIDYTWITNYSLKFQGCHAHTALNLEADNENDVIIKTVKMAHFRLCPTSSCQTWLGGGCSSNYADYVVDLETFAKSYIQSQRRAREYECQLYMLAECDCQEGDDRDDGWKREYCEYDCYSNSKLYKDCTDRNPYEEENGGERQRRFEPERYMECKEWERNEGGDKNNNNGDDDGDQTQYYIGPYCSAKGGEVYLGLYTDDTCTNFADSTNGRSTYTSLSGNELPYSTTSLVTSSCVSCIEVEDLNRKQDEKQDDAYGDDAEDADEVSEQCERLYKSAGKCEMSLSSDSGVEPNNNACSYIGGIQFTKINGIVERKSGDSSTANVFIGLFATAFVAMGAVVYQLRKKVTDAKASPLIEKDDSQEDKPLDSPEDKPVA